MMRLAVSNLAIPISVTTADLEGLRALGVDGLEVAPTRLAPWDDWSPSRLADYRMRLADADLLVSSLQAILFGTEGLHLLGGEAAFEAMLAHVRRVAEIGSALRARIGVFGSPRNRLRGELPAEVAWELARTRFARMADAVAEFGFTLGLEPVPPAYGGDFLTVADDVIRMVAEVGHPGLRVHLDTGCVLLGGDAIDAAVMAAGNLLSHFHIAEPKLGPFHAPACPHATAAAALRDIAYDGWVAVEMLEQKESPLEAVRKAASFAVDCYLRPLAAQRYAPRIAMPDTLSHHLKRANQLRHSGQIAKAATEPRLVVNTQPSEEVRELLAQIDAIQLLPAHDKDLLRSHACLGYGHAERSLPDLSIFSTLPTRKEWENYTYADLHGVDIYYAGIFAKTHLAIFVDEEKKILFPSRYYLTHFAQFIRHIDHCLHNLSRIDFTSFEDIGSDYVAIEKWFITYGHFKDEAYSLGHFLHSHPDMSDNTALLDYPVDERMNTEAFRSNPNYQKIDRLIFGDRSLNPYRYGDKVLKLRNLTLIANGFKSKTFHRFPESISDHIRRQVIDDNTPNGPERIFLTRSSSYRDIANKTATEAYFVRAGFTLINPEGITYEELVRQARNASMVAMYWGSAMTNMVYFKNNAHVFILKSQSYLHENMSLWQKVINGYHLDVVEIPAVDNMIREEDLARLVGLDPSE
jgi:sugar phosphate isomerase/epimerase